VGTVTPPLGDLYALAAAGFARAADRALSPGGTVALWRVVLALYAARFGGDGPLEEINRSPSLDALRAEVGWGLRP
jgi:hypothetical protein